MRKVNFSKIENIEDIAKNFYTSKEYVNNLLTTSDQQIYFKELKIPKKNRKYRGSYRVVYKADKKLAQLLKNINTAIAEQSEFFKYVQGFIKKRSIVSNAFQHLDCEVLLNADITNFFQSLGIEQVKKVFKELGCNENISQHFAKICTINGTLAQGLSTSPILSNLICAKLDTDIQKLCIKYEATYTRYGDDISISSLKDIPSKENIYSIIKKHKLKPNETKYRLVKKGQPQYVTGLSVSNDKYPRVPRKIKRNLRLTLYYINKYGLFNHMKRTGINEDRFGRYLAWIEGYIKYIYSIEPLFAEELNSNLKNGIKKSKSTSRI